MANASAHRILIADDQPDVIEALRFLLKSEGYATEAAKSSGAVIKAVEANDYALVLMDLNLRPRHHQRPGRSRIAAKTPGARCRPAGCGHDRLGQRRCPRRGDAAGRFRQDLLFRLMPKRRRRLSHEQTVLVYALLSGLPAVILGHELNNSLAPIKSIAGSLSSLLKSPRRAPDWEDDMRKGLEIIGPRADSLSRFMQASARLARLPQPTLAPTALRPLVQRVVALETRLPIEILARPDLVLSCDSAQIEQVLINLVKNAVEAALEQRANATPAAGVRLRWRKVASSAALRAD